MKNLVVLTGAGMSAESGIQTFRDAGGLWEGYDVMEVASPEGWRKNPGKVLDFYNARKQNVLDSKPNQGHLLLAELEQKLAVTIITQNIDDLHERAGSSKVIHLHGEIRKCRSVLNKHEIWDCKEPIKLGDLCPKGGQIRPHIVWFGEAVPKIDEAIPIIVEADILLVIGTSMDVYPAAGLVNYAKNNIPIILIDPNPNHQSTRNFKHIVKGASEGIKDFIDRYI